MTKPHGSVPGKPLPNGNGYSPPMEERIKKPGGDAFDQFLPSFGASQACEWAWIDEGFCEQYPRLYALLSKCLVAGKTRDTSILKVMCGDGAFKVAISDRQTGQTWWCTLNPLPNLLDAVETALRDQRGEWRKDKPWVNRK
jgi:hypothetical protein